MNTAGRRVSRCALLLGSGPAFGLLGWLLVWLLVWLLGWPAAGPAWGQAHPGCPVRPQTVAAMHGCYRPVLVFSPAAADPRFRQQKAMLDSAADDVMDRNMLFVPLLPPPAPGDGAGYVPPLDAPSATLPEEEDAALRKRFRVAGREFRVVLLGEDGGAKLESAQPVPVDRLNSLIDSMPTRQREMKQPHSN